MPAGPPGPRPRYAMTAPRITVITVNKDNGDYLEQTLVSVLDQGYTNFEYFVLVGGSTDGSVDVVRRYAHDLVAWRSRADGGPADAINEALQQATGQIVTVVPSGDLLLPGALHEAARAMSPDDPPWWWVGHSRRIGLIDDDRGELRATLPETTAAYLMHDSGVIPALGSFWRRELFERYGAFDSRLRHAFAYDWAARLLLEGRRPNIAPVTLAAHRETVERSVDLTIRAGLETITVARRHGPRLPLPERFALWRNCEARQRIYTLAQAEMRDADARTFLAQHILRHPWWLADAMTRQTLLHGVQHPLPAGTTRHAA